MTEKRIDERWIREARAIAPDQTTIRLPLHALLAEAVDIAKTVAKYWDTVTEPDTGQVVRIGLDSLGARLPASMAGDLLSLREAVQQAQSAYLLASEQRVSAPTDRARFVLGELTATLEYLFDDGVEDEKDAQLAAAKASHAQHPETMDALAAQLEDYAAIAKEYEKDMDGLGGFDARLIQEAVELARTLRDQPATAQHAPVTKAAEAMLLRNQLAALLFRKIAICRNAIRFVFRRHPDVVREAASTYYRKKKAESRRRAKQQTNLETPR